MVDSSKITRELSKSSADINRSFTRLSSGKRINKASDDAAGLAISEALISNVRTSNQAARNSLDGISQSEIADSALSSISNITARQSELATQAANGTYSDAQRAPLNEEYQALEQEKNRIIQTTQFNGQNVFQGTSLQVGNDGSANSQISTPSVSTSSITSAQNISSQAGARAAIDSLATQGDSLSQVRGQIGASVSRIEVAERNSRTEALESEKAASRIRDADVADETANLTSARIRQQTTTALSAQAAKINSDSVLKLLS